LRLAGLGLFLAVRGAGGVFPPQFIKVTSPNYLSVAL
jgi:hypothetical protein